MARRRFRRKDLKRPDEFVSRGGAALAWARENARTVGWAAGAVALVLVGITGFFSVRDARIRQANDDLALALTEYRAGHYAAAATQLSDVANRWQSTVAGQVADLYAGSADLKADNLDSAMVPLQAALNVKDWPPYLRQQALLDLGLALERKGDHQTAAARYAEAASLQGPYTALALLGEARNREQLGEKDKARTLYERFVQEFPQAPEIEIATAKIDSLKG